MGQFLIIIKADWNDADYIYTIMDNCNSSKVELAKLARKHMDYKGRSHNFEKFIGKFDIERGIDEDDFEDAQDQDKYFDEDGNFIDTDEDIEDRYEQMLRDDYGDEVFDAMTWLAENAPRSYDGDLHTVHEITIYEYNKKH